MTSTATSDAAILRLRAVKERREAVLEQAAEVEQELEDAIVQAFDNDVPKRLIAREAGCVRQTVYNVLARKGRA